MSDHIPKISDDVGNSNLRVLDTDNAGMRSQLAVHGFSVKPVPVASMSPPRSRPQAMPPPPSLPLAGEEEESKVEKTLEKIDTTPSKALGAGEVKSLLRDVEPPAELQLIFQDNLADFIASAYGHSNLFELASPYTDTIPSLVQQVKSAHSQVTHSNLKNRMNKIVKRLTIDEDSTSQENRDSGLSATEEFQSDAKVPSQCDG
ncbi:hypothetical protein QAD02_020753 [Eretmocerus hayati]|uniref:Uncharacterized protein n=1 Tax=Eretmocerus hayati TaxID=131215 RepID=A0ACC2PT34_9HYME|nr:hypothetical protein QAD02_020753 [Eretmocerus hayati]